MNVSLSSFISGIRTAMGRFNVSSHDVANVNTPGYREGVAHQVESNLGGARISHVSKTPNAGSYSNTDLAAEASEQIGAKHALKANARGLKVQNDMLGELIDLVG